MKKQYMKPQVEVIEVKGRAQLLAGSGKPDQWGAPGLDFDDEDVW
jgi:hypothetical protein